MSDVMTADNHAQQMHPEASSSPPPRLRCRSDCNAPVTRRVVAVSGSDRVWTSPACDNDTHLVSALNAVKALGFTIQTIEDIP